jgi:predicted house-cleaning noncanonical NTP pyrophosphatase (MazG superfamily)
MEGRKEKLERKILGELEQYLQKPAEEWEWQELELLDDILRAVTHQAMAYMSNNNDSIEYAMGRAWKIAEEEK